MDTPSDASKNRNFFDFLSHGVTRPICQRCILSGVRLAVCGGGSGDGDGGGGGCISGGRVISYILS